MTGKKLWSPITTETNINSFVNFINKKEELISYKDLHKWSIEKKRNILGSSMEIYKYYWRKKRRYF